MVRSFSSLSSTALTLGAVKLVLSELAAFHASGYLFIRSHPDGLQALAEEYPGIFQIAGDYFKSLAGVDDMLEKFLQMTLQMYSSCFLVVQKYGSKELAQKMETFQPKVIEVMRSFFLSSWKHGFITHGDAWYNNFLFRYEMQLKGS